jgi:pimeloyl-ACP methyl ester carboxylesterase
VHRPDSISAVFIIFIVFAPVELSAQKTPENHTFSVHGIVMKVEVVGEGQPLVLLHSGTQTARMFDAYVEAFSAHYRLIIPDLRGHGGSTNPDGIWTTRQFARDVYSLLDELGVDKFKAIGASAGAMTLLHMATSKPERVEAMMVVGVGTYLPPECREILARTSPDDITEANWKHLREEHEHGDEQIRALYNWVASLATSYNDMTFTPPYLSTIKARTLVVHGDRDYCFPASMAWDIYDAIPKAYLWVVPNGGHVPMSGPYVEPVTRTALAFLRGDWEKN